MKHRSFIIAFILIFCISIVCILSSLTHRKNVAEIYLDGNLIETIDLVKVENPYEISLPHNTILVEHGDISVIFSDCPDKLCVNQGKISNSTLPIVCLPNKLIIQIKE